MIDLPNDQWVRSHTKHDWALCLNPRDAFYGWKMYECNGNWVSGARLTIDEVQTALGKVSLREHWPKFETLLVHVTSLGEHLD